MTTSSDTGCLHRPDPNRLRAVHFEDPDARVPRPLDPQIISHFDVFGLDVRLCLDTEALREAFLELSRAFHPDYFATDKESVREEALRRTSLVNNAHKTLRDAQPRAEYTINLVGGGLESNKNAVPPELLEEVFEIQEAGEELRAARLAADEERLAKAEAAVKPLREEVKAARERLASERDSLFAEFDRAAETAGPETAGPESDSARDILRRIRLTLDRMNYLRTVLRNLK